MIEHALRLAQQGWRIFPLRPNSKKPRIGFDDWPAKATTDAATITQWWTAEPAANIGLIPALALDFDMKPGQHGAESLDMLRMMGLPETTSVRTASGGLHLLYSLPEGVEVPNSVGKVAPNVDVRGSRGYVVAAGSTIDGTPYVSDGHAIAEAPDWLIAMCGKPRDEREATAPATDLDTPAAIANATHWLRHNAPEAIEGAGGDATTYKVIARTKDFGISEPHCFEVLWPWNMEKAMPPWDPAELAQKIANAYAYGSRAPGALSAEAEFDDVSATVVDRRKAPAPQPTRPGLFRRKFNAGRARALLAAANPLVKNLLDVGAMSVMYGDSGTGKTFVALDLAYHVAAGLRWNGQRTTQGPVLYVAAEAGESINARLDALGRQYAPADEPPLDTVPCLVDLFDPKADLKPLIALVDQMKAEYGRAALLIVVDTLARAMGAGNESETRDMNQFVKSIDTLREATGAHLMVVHHTGKDASKGARGSSALRAATDTEIEVGGNAITVKKQRARSNETVLPIRFVLKQIEIGQDTDGDRVTSCVVELRAGNADVPINLTGEEEGWLEALEAGARIATKTPTGTGSYSFNIRFACATLLPNTEMFKSVQTPESASVSGIITDNSRQFEHVQTSVPNDKRVAVRRMLVTLEQKGAIKKAKRGQWVMEFEQLEQT